MDALTSGREVVKAIRVSGLRIYDDLTEKPSLLLSKEQLEAVLDEKLRGLDLAYPIRTRSKVVKQAVCRALGHPVPSSFKKTQPRFPGQDFDTYVQKADNLQIWNEEVSASRRYVLIRVNADDVVTRVRVVTGNVIAAYDTTGTLTQKYQAASREPVIDSVLVSESDTSRLQELVRQSGKGRHAASAPFTSARFLPVRDLYDRLVRLVGESFSNPGLDQERNRGAAIHAMAEEALGSLGHSDTGQFPDVLEQLLEIKLQTSPTIDLGLVSPDSTEMMGTVPGVRHCDVRYAVFYATLSGDELTIDNVVVSTGESFFTFFRRFEGLEVNKKIQIHLPNGFFDDAE